MRRLNICLVPCLALLTSQAAHAFLIPPPWTAKLWGGSSQQRVLSSDDDPQLPPPAFPHHPDRRPAGFVALGDSYSAGIGTGVEGKEDDCRRGLGAYPTLLRADLEASEGPNQTSFQFLSCTGAVIDDILAGRAHSQIDELRATPEGAHGPDFAVLSIGGNDLGFFDVINACVFRFYSFYSGTCETALARSNEAIASQDFEHRLQVLIMEILDKVRWERRPWFAVTVTGYARFFNAETDECDDYSFGIWWRGPKLKKDVRSRMNDLVGRVNAKIERSIDLINARFARPKVFFVDYDARFEGHRFCEPGVVEPDYNRTDSWFFLVGGIDNAPGTNTTDPMPGPPPPLPGPPNGTDPIANLSRTAEWSAAGMLPPTSPLTDPETCLERAQARGDWGELAICYMAMARWRDPSLAFARDEHEVMAQNSMWYVPTYYGKTFHPRTLGHQVMRDEIYKVWDAQLSS